MDEACEHKFIHLDSKSWTDATGTYQIGWFRMDSFFCEKCLDVKFKRREEWSRNKPEWY